MGQAKAAFMLPSNPAGMFSRILQPPSPTPAGEVAATGPPTSTQHLSGLAGCKGSEEDGRWRKRLRGDSNRRRGACQSTRVITAATTTRVQCRVPLPELLAITPQTTAKRYQSSRGQTTTHCVTDTINRLSHWIMATSRIMTLRGLVLDKPQPPPRRPVCLWMATSPRTSLDSHGPRLSRRFWMPSSSHPSPCSLDLNSFTSQPSSPTTAAAAARCTTGPPPGGTIVLQGLKDLLRERTAL